MLRSILVALDDTGASRAAQELGIDFAREHDAQITGLAILDREHIVRPTPVGIGGFAYKQHRDQVKLEQAHRFLERLEQQFGKKCEDLGSAWQVLEVEGAPFDIICGEAHRHDLVVIGRDTDFHLDEEPAVADVVHRLLEHNPRPVLVCPEDAGGRSGPILCASDGGPRSSRAMHMLALLGLARQQPVHILAIGSSDTEARLFAERPADLLGRYGMQVGLHPVITRAEPVDVICEQAERLGASMVVVGSSGHGRLRDFFVGSTARSLLNGCPYPVFVSH